MGGSVLWLVALGSVPVCCHCPRGRVRRVLLAAGGDDDDDYEDACVGETWRDGGVLSDADA
jgi:hypothetical protein